MLKYIYLILFCLSSFKSYSNIIIEWNEKLNEWMTKDGFSPLLATRTFLYPNIACYLILEPKNKELFPLNTLSNIDLQLKFNKRFDSEIAICEAFYRIASELSYRPKECAEFYNQKMLLLKNSKSKKIVNQSIDVGVLVANKVLNLAKNDLYLLTKAKEFYIVKKDEKFWKPTPPEYREALEPHWGTLKTYILDSINEGIKGNPISFSTEKNSEFYKQNEGLYLLSKNLTGEQKEIARFWDDNPDLNTFIGHIPMPRRQMSPAAHWMSILRIVLKQSKANLVLTAKAHTLLSLALEDCKIAVWHWKYKTELIRPVSYIRKYIDKDWMPLLVTPPFPEHPSGHSACSMASAIILEYLFGSAFEFTDNSLEGYNINARTFKSFRAAALEVSESRVLGGIHYRSGTESGMKLGAYIAEKLIGKLQKR
jgi:hypothetical protein